ncbi:MAG: DsbA family protein [Saprospiraceae bacterium]|nr:DsbA family protein [Saprospiraceae bacterium]
MQIFSIQMVLFALALSSCQGQNNKLVMMNDLKASNPLLCDVETGVCETPGLAGTADEIHLAIGPKPVQILYFTDPICSSCWGIEPQLRRLKLEYGALLNIEYRMGGLLPSWEVYNSGSISKPSDVAHHWDEVSLHYEMPIDGDVWLEDPLPSSYPPSIAFKAAQMQDEKKAIQFLRRIREMVFMEKKNITKWAHLEAAAKQVGLDAVKMKADFEGEAKALFQKDLDLARSLNVRSFPTMIFSDADQQRLVLKGVRPYEQFEQTLLALHPSALKNAYNTTPEALFAQYPTLTNKEFEVLAGVSKETAEKTLAELLARHKLAQYQSKNGVIWKKVD